MNGDKIQKVTRAPCGMSVNIYRLMLTLVDGAKPVKGKCQYRWAVEVQICGPQTVASEKEVESHQLSLREMMQHARGHPVSGGKKMAKS